MLKITDYLYIFGAENKFLKKDRKFWNNMLLIAQKVFN